jgi:pilus assembly protein Flp/PilA
MRKVLNSLRRLRADESGAGMVEYALLVALIGVLLIGALGTLRGGIENTFTQATTTLNGGGGGGG